MICSGSDQNDQGENKGDQGSDQGYNQGGTIRVIRAVRVTRVRTNNDMLRSLAIRVVYISGLSER